MEKDILHTLSSDLKKTPYTVPEGYFESFRDRMYRTENLIEPRGIFSRMAPYLSMAAAFAAIAMVGTVLLRNTDDSDQMTYEDYIVHSDMMISSIYEEEYQVAEAENPLADEDIINYLIYTGTTAENIEFDE